METALEDIQEKLWELDKSWKNNLVSLLSIIIDELHSLNLLTHFMKVLTVSLFDGDYRR